MSTASNTQNLAATPGMNILVSASAGTGKTKVLTDRFIRLMLHGTPPDKILCLTFTNAAAVEMKQRIMGKLSAWHKATPTDIESDLAAMGEEATSSLSIKAANLYKSFHSVFDNLKIMTIHSLCSEIMKRFYNINSSKIEILEPYEADQFQLNIIKQTLSDAVAKQEEPYRQHYLLLSDYIDPYQIYDLIQQILSKTRFLSAEECLTQDIYDLHQANIALTPTDIIISAMNRITVNKKRWLELEAMLEESKEKLSFDLKAMLETEDVKEAWPAYLDLFLTKERKARQRLVSKKFSTSFPILFNLLLEEQGLAEESWKAYKRQLSALLNDAAASLAYKCLNIVNNTKTKTGLFTFDDLIAHTLDLLHNSPKAPGVLYNLNYQIDHLLADESQDNNESQWQIIKALTEEFFVGESARTEERTIFIVGDMKQSIFSFQGASPDLFQEIGCFFADKVKGVDKHWHHLDMQTSFRSTQTVLDLVNRVFATLPLHKSNQIIRHIAHRDGEGIVELWPLVKKEEMHIEEGWTLPDYEDKELGSIELVASNIADKIISWIGKREISSRAKIIEAQDIMILVKKRGPVVSALKRHLHQANIKVVECSKSKLNEHIIAHDLLSLLRFFIDNEDDLNLACLLKSPFFNISEEELFTICYGRKGTVWHNLSTHLPNHYNELLKFKELHHRCTVLQILMHILYHQGKIDHFLARFGQEANTVIAAFLDAVAEFEQKHMKGYYYDFIEWFKTASIDLQNNMDDKDAVRIMTVHASKGLQAPIVILADAASTEYAPHQKVFGCYGIPIVTISAEYDDELIISLKNNEQLERALENNRLLYVAITRAEDEIYAIGHHTNRIKGSWYDILSQHVKQPSSD